MAVSKDLFVSYSREDTVIKFVRKLKRDLERAQLSVWLDLEDVPTGTEKSLAVAIGFTALNNSKALIAVLTKNYISSTFCEVYFACRNQKPIFPVVREEGWDAAVVSEECSKGVKYMKDACNLVRFLPSDDYGAALQKLVENVSKQAPPTKLTLKDIQNELSEVTRWYSLGIQLGLAPGTLHNIESNHSHDADRCKIDVLDWWLRNEQDATWEKLAQALEAMCGHDVLVRKLREKTHPMSKGTEVTQATGSLPHRPTSNSTSTTTTTSGTGNASTTTAQNQSTAAKAIARRNIRKIQGKFSMLVTKSRRKLQKKEIDIEDVQTFLVTMYSCPNSRDGSDVVTTVLESAKSLDEVISALSKNRLWDYLNYDLLQEIIEEFARDDDELIGMMEQYQQDLTGHILTLKIETYLKEATHDEPPITTSDSETPGDEIIPALPQQKKHRLFKELSFKVDVNVADHTLGYVYDLWRSLRKQFVLPRPAMILQRIAEGCICITWLTPNNVVKHVTRMVQETSDMFAEQHILRVMLDEHCIYPMETLTEQPLPDSEKATFKMKEAESQECVRDIVSGEFECKVREEKDTPAVVKFQAERSIHKEDPDTRGVPQLSPLSPPPSAKEKQSGREEVTEEQRSKEESQRSQVPQFKRRARVITSDKEFERELRQAGEALVVVDITTERCRWTVYLDLVFAMLEKRYTEAKFLSVDAEKCKSTATKYNVCAFPTYAFFRKGELLRMFHGNYREPVATVKYFLECKEEGRHSLVKSITSDEEFEQELKQTGETLVVVDFTADWCGWSVIMDPINAVFSEHFTAAQFLKVDSEKCRRAASRCGVRSFPTFAFIRREKLLDKFSGASPEKLVVTIKHFLESDSKGAYSPGKGHSRVRVISSDKQFERELRQPEEILVVANFTAAGSRWSMFMDPVFAVLSEHYPAARFLQVDANNCRGAAIRCDVRMEEIPMFAFFRKANLLHKFSGFQCKKLATTVKHYLEGKGVEEKSSKEQPFYIIVDPSEPTTKVKIRLADGSNLIETFNHSHTVGDLRHFISSSRPELAASSYTLVTSYPEKELKDDTQTLAAAELFNAFITQKTEKLAWK